MEKIEIPVSPYDPRKKKRDYWNNPSVLKIVCSVSTGHKKRKEIESRTIAQIVKKENYDLGLGEKIYLNAGILNKYLSGNKKNMVKEGFLIVTNAKDGLNYKSRKTTSKEEYIFDINYDKLVEKFMHSIDEKRTDALKKLKITKETLNKQIILQKNKVKRYENELRRVDVELAKRREISKRNRDGISVLNEKGKVLYEELDLFRKKRSNARTMIAVYERFISKTERMNENLNELKPLIKQEKKIIISFLRSIFYNYYLSCEESKTLSDLFELVQMQIMMGKVVLLPDRVLNDEFEGYPLYQTNDCKSGIFLKIKEKIESIQEIAYLDLWD